MITFPRPVSGSTSSRTSVPPSVQLLLRSSDWRRYCRTSTGCVVGAAAADARGTISIHHAVASRIQCRMEFKMLTTFPKLEEVRELIQLARREDLHDDDVTSRLLVGEDAVGVGTLLQKEVGIACGLPIVEHICRAYDERLRVEQIPGFHLDIIEGRFSDAKVTPLLRIRGPLRSLLSAERVILNFLQHLSGVATQTNRYVRRIEGSGAKIYDTRKTLPGFRALDKYAV